MSFFLHKNTAPSFPVTSRWRTPLVLLALGLLCLSMYGNTLKAPFVFDDTLNIPKNPHIRIRELSLSSLAGVFQSRSISRPMAVFSFAFNHYLHGYQVAGYHLFNWLVHLINGWLVYLLARQTLRLLKKKLPAAPFLAAALWLANPVHTQSVTYIVQRMNSLSALFYLASLALYIRARTLPVENRRRKTTATLFFSLSAVSGICALASKEIAVTLPAMIFLYEWFFIRDLEAGFVKKQAAYLFAMAAAVTVIIFIFLKADPVTAVLSMYDKLPFTMGERLLTQPRVIFHYISLLLLPLPERLNIEHYVTVSRSLTNPPVTAAALGLLLLTTVMAIVKARSNRLLSFAVLWFLGTLAVESSVIGLAMTVEHRTYLPSVFLFIAAARGLLGHIRPAWLATGTLTLLILVSGFWTRQRNAVWADEVRLWQDAVRKSPGSIRSYNNLGVALSLQGRHEEGIAACRRSIALTPPSGNTADAYNNITRMYHDLGDNEKAIEYGRRAIQIDPDSPEAHMNLGQALLAENRPVEAIASLETALRLSPWLTPAYPLLARAYYSTTGDIDQAVDLCRRALAIDPGFLEAESLLGALLQHSGDLEQALFHLRRVLEARPGHPQANLNAGIVYNKLGRPEQALIHLTRAAAAMPDHARTRSELGSSLMAINQIAVRLAEKGHFEEATAALEQLEKRLPGAPTISYNLACLYAQRNQPEKALDQLEKAMEKGYNDWETLRTDPDLEPIRETPGYQKLIRSLEP